MPEDRVNMGAIIFDLDGTLADSLSLGIEILNDLKIVDHTVTREDYERVKNLAIPAIFKEFGVPLWRAPQIAVKGRKALTKRIGEIPLFPGMSETLQVLSEKHRLFVVSSNSLVNVRKFLDHHKVRSLFEQVYGGVGLFNKAKVLGRIVKQHNLVRQRTFYVGDEVRDISAAKKVRLRSIAVTWGFNGENILRSKSPDFVIHSPMELMKTIEKS